MDSIVDVFSATHQFRLDPARFLVAWNGVLVLAFEGFPCGIEAAKYKLIEKLPLIQENPGSKWPKVTLAALSGCRPLLESDFETLNAILSRHSEKLRNCHIVFDAVSIVQFNCRSLESIRDRYDIALRDPLNQDQISPEQRRINAAILAEPDSLDYFSLASRAGRDINYYRENHVEWTLVSFLNGALEDEITLLCKEIEGQLPDLYEWIRPESRHVTLLGLDRLVQ